MGSKGWRPGTVYSRQACRQSLDAEFWMSRVRFFAAGSAGGLSDLLAPAPRLLSVR